MKLIELVVDGLGVIGDLGRPAQIHLTDLPPHSGRGIEDLADQATYPARKLGGQTSSSAAGQLGGPSRVRR